MAGRGRGFRTLSFNVDSVVLNRGEGLPAGLQQPTPVFPVMEQKPLPLTGGEEAEYLLALKQDFRGAMKSLPCFIQPAAAQRDVERYSDKYHSSEQTDDLLDWTPDWKRLPKELRIQVKKPSRVGVSLKGEPEQKKKKVKEKEEVLLKLETLEKKEEQESSEEEEGQEKKKQQEEEEAEAEEEYDEEEFEEETDYIMSYFDNGEEFGADSDDNMDEAIY
ncbi:DNA-directed RNA polymerase III subunit RPC7-like [Salarias fasciatus]|uniref:DNA-directed RNA polymerase III subunit RPC7-like n=1 Tax=Salarias fasciatus TaxID=181472 RepID=UPI001176AFB0|nr:DNA-directed RNA polymerase III subunit RPC7-like [Salarias fasciatus]